MNVIRKMMQFGRKTILLQAILAIAVLLGSPTIGRADSYSDYLLAVAGIRLGTVLGDYTPSEEEALVAFAWKQYRQEQEKLGIPAVGQVAFNTIYPSAIATIGSTETLTFQFIDPATGLPTSGPAVASVLYEANYDPNSPTTFVPLGTSTDVAGNFDFAYVVTGQEPVINAIPMDASGNPIVISGVDGDNDAQGGGLLVTVPEPSTLTMFTLGFLSCGAYAYPRCRRRGSGGKISQT